MTEIDRSSPGPYYDVVGSNFATGTIQGYPAEKIPTGKRQKIDHGPVVPVIAHAVDVSWLSGVACINIFEVDRNYQRYLHLVDDDAGQPVSIPADVVDHIDDVFAQDALSEGARGSCLTTDHRYDICTASAGLSKTVIRWRPISPNL